VEPTIFEPGLKFKPRRKFFKFGLWLHEWGQAVLMMAIFLLRNIIS